MNITKLLLKIVKGIVGIQISVSNWEVGILALRGPLKNMVIVCDYCIRRCLLIKSIHCDIDYMMALLDCVLYVTWRICVF